MNIEINYQKAIAPGLRILTGEYPVEAKVEAVINMVLGNWDAVAHVARHWKNSEGNIPELNKERIRRLSDDFEYKRTVDRLFEEVAYIWAYQLLIQRTELRDEIRKFVMRMENVRFAWKIILDDILDYAVQCGVLLIK